MSALIGLVPEPARRHNRLRADQAVAHAIAVDELARQAVLAQRVVGALDLLRHVVALEVRYGLLKGCGKEVGPAGGRFQR